MLNGESHRGWAELRDDLKALVLRAELPTLLVTHDRDDAKALADRVVHLSAGRVVEIEPGS